MAQYKGFCAVLLREMPTPQLGIRMNPVYSIISEDVGAQAEK
jgi:hypothetical protein